MKKTAPLSSACAVKGCALLLALAILLGSSEGRAQAVKPIGDPAGWKTAVQPVAQQKNGKRSSKARAAAERAKTDPAVVEPSNAQAAAGKDAAEATKPTEQGEAPAAEAPTEPVKSEPVQAEEPGKAAQTEGAKAEAEPAKEEPQQESQQESNQESNQEAKDGKAETNAQAKDEPASASAEEKSKSEHGSEAEKSAANEKAKPAPLPETKRTTSYCLNIANQALDARYMLQKKRLEDLKSDIQNRTTALETKIGELRDWYKKREDFVKKARTNLVGIYTSMKAEAAAKQLAEIDEETASALLSEIDARQSSAILSEMDSKKAARLTGIMAGAVEVKAAVAKPAAPQGGARTPAQPPARAKPQEATP